MSRSILNIIEWEHPPEGTSAVLHDNASRILGPGSSLKNLAIAKMTDVSVISTHFGEEQLVFEPWVSVLLDAGKALMFYAAYALSFPLDREHDGLPHICLRMCSWDQKSDFTQFEQSENKRDYLTSDKQLHSDILFEPFSRAAAFQGLHSRLSECLGQGLDGQCTVRPNAAWQKVSVNIETDEFSWRFSYSPATFIAEKLEDWITAWQEAFKQSASLLVPTDVTEISYRSSVIESIGNA